jgi:hypothetical protein
LHRLDRSHDLLTAETKPGGVAERDTCDVQAIAARER